MADIVEGDLVVRGRLQAGYFSPPNQSVGGAAINTADPISVAAQRHQYMRTVAQNFGAPTASGRTPIHIARAAGTIRTFRMGQSVANIGAATVTVTLLKNGSNILSATFQLTNAQAAFATIQASFTSAAYAAGDFFEVNITAAAGGGTLGQGFLAQLELDEAES